MGYFPKVWIAPQSMSSLSEQSLGRFLVTAPGGSTAWSLANRAILIPLELPDVVVAKRLFMANGATASGNVDVGLYDAALNKIVAMGSTAQSGTTTLQFFDIADTRVGPGLIYLAVAMDNTTGTYQASLGSFNMCRIAGTLQMASAFPLPATITAAAAVVGAPIVGFEIGRLV